MQFHLETENNLIISDFRPEECIDFLSMESISDVGIQFPKPQNNKYNVEPPPNSKDLKEKVILSPLSPNFEGLKDCEQLILLPSQNQTQRPIQQKSSIQLISKNHKQSTNFSGSFMKYFHTRRFVNRILRNKHMFHKLQPLHLEIINDASSHYDTEIFGQKSHSFKPLGLMKTLHLSITPSLPKKIIAKYRQISNLILNKFQQVLLQIPVIQPENKGRIIWDVVLSITRLYFIILIPIDMVFEERLLYSEKLIIITTLQTFLLIFDMFINFNTAYYQFGQIVSERSKIIHHNFSKGYGLDAFSVIFLICLLFVNWDSIGDYEPFVFIGLLSFTVQYQNITKLTRIFEEVLNLNKIQAGFLELAKLITLLLYILHISACIWIGCGRISSSVTNGTSWMIKEDILNEQWIVQYLRSFYFCTVTMFTIGYGDLTPQQYVTCIIFIMIFSIQLPYSVNTVGAIIDEISKYSEQKLQKLRIINTYMAKKKITYELQVKIRQYLAYYWECQNTQISQEVKGILEQLSENLRDSLMLEANSIILNSCDMFSKFLSPGFTKALVNKIRYLDVQPENIVDFTDQPDSYQNYYLAFIEIGTIQVIQDQNNCKNDSYIKQLSPGQVFGLYEFITGTYCNEFYKSKGFTKLLVLPRNQFLKILREFPEDKEKYCQIRDDLLYNNGEQFLRDIGVQCYMCNSRDHITKFCPMVHYCADKEKIIKSQTYIIKQPRVKQKRKVRRSQFNGKSDQKIIMEIAQYFKEDFWKQCQYYEINDIDFDQQQQSPQYSITSDEVKDYIKQTPQLHISKTSQINQNKHIKQQRIGQLNEIHQSRRAARQNTISPLMKFSTNQQIADQFTSNELKVIPRAHSSLVDNVSQQESQITPEKQEDEEGTAQKSNQQIVSIKGDQFQIKKRCMPQPQQSQFTKRLKNLKIEIEKDPQKKMSLFNTTDLELQENWQSLEQRIIQLKSFQEQETTVLQLQNLSILIQNQLNDKFMCLENFDLQRDFQFYLPHNNFTQLEVSNCYNKHLIENLSRFIKYLFYPFVYIKKYSKLNVEEDYKLERQRKTMSFSKKKATVVIKFRDKAKQIINSRRIVPE
ncbi:unnamed protein product [Paramecium primaurelia]|uniref:Cyclic nucleotide-binding domain-containing protein n=1 Tax=Paramecium primaurelia TaxID=5886 RepID=A0A8S1KEB7_PARPR|nr:unnamed protein product [Paramecium primaurelia]